MRTYDIITDEQVNAKHPRQAAVLITIPPEHRQAVMWRAYLLQNLTGGIYSQALAEAKRDLERVGIEGMEDIDRRDNHAAMADCARRGCTACAKDVR